jgi:predicted RNA-binding Zn ribbon-like protein
VLCFLAAVFPLSQGQNAGSAISQAQNAFASSVEAVAQAQSSGANVDVLMATLNEAASLLSKAQLANSAGDYSSANDYANQCMSKISSVNNEASALQKEATDQKNQSSIYTALTLMVSAALFVSGIVMWSLLSKQERSVNGAK